MGKAQAMIMSAIVTIVILIMVISLFISQFQSLFQSDNRFKELQRESSNIGMMLTGNPYPLDWEVSTVKKLGLVDNNIIKEDVLGKYGDLSYSQTKKLLGIKGEYLFFFENSFGDPISIPDGEYIREYWGWNGNETPIGGSNLDDAVELILANSEIIVKNEKFVMLRLDDKIMYVKLVIYVWDFVYGDVDLDPWSGIIEYDFSAFLQTTKDEYTTGETVNLTRNV